MKTAYEINLELEIERLEKENKALRELLILIHEQTSTQWRQKLKNDEITVYFHKDLMIRLEQLLKGGEE